MMNRTGCERVVGRLDRFLDGDLTATEQARDAGHLEVCATCARELEARQKELARVRAALSGRPEEIEIALSLVHAALEERLEERAVPRYRLRIVARRALVPLLTAAAALLVLSLMRWTPFGTDITTITSLELPSWNVSLPTGTSLLGELEEAK
ncbi:MAG TPA: hypothetical protein ENJ09_16040 [Planctomycetes bacterium]|nr:hypothetical protein [Planctomycetota bacterium]